jgi:two-component system response regulator NreC
MKVLLTATQNNFINTFAKLFQSESSFQIGTIIAEKSSIYQFVLNNQPDIAFFHGESSNEIIQQIKSDFSITTRCVYVVPNANHSFLTQEFHILADAYIAESSQEKIYTMCIERLLLGQRYTCPLIIEQMHNNPILSEYSHLLAKLGNKEFQVFRLIGFNYTIKKIAELLFISTNTVESHRNNLIKKLSVNDAKELRKLASQIVYGQRNSTFLIDNN